MTQQTAAPRVFYIITAWGGKLDGRDKESRSKAYRTASTSVAECRTSCPGCWKLRPEIACPRPTTMQLSTTAPSWQSPYAVQRVVGVTYVGSGPLEQFAANVAKLAA
mmetsp:Transcript_114517/g.334821  ORF Transcript_114517/g.334821 Transcript_114517/m.334821 type:complete len:107 (-) Transcript_114517:27-347(-)